jgi:hypothetical protein
MTAYEYLEIGQSNISNAIALVSLAIAVLSGYVVVAYTVGAKLTRPQVVLLNMNYSIWGFYLITSGGTSLQNGLDRVYKAQGMLGESVVYIPLSIHIYYSLGALIFSTSLWFMWSVRHPKVE